MEDTHSSLDILADTAIEKDTRSSLDILADTAIDEDILKTEIENMISGSSRQFRETIIQDIIDDLNGKPLLERIKTCLSGLSRYEKIKLLESVKEHYIALEKP